MAVAEHAKRANAQPIGTGQVTGRRTVHYNSLDELLADAERLAKSPHHMVGNWSYGMILQHLAGALLMGLDGGVPAAPWPIRAIARLVFKNRILRGPMPAGRKLPKKAADKLIPGATSDETGLASLRTAIARWKVEPHRLPHPFFGQITSAEWDQLMLRHAELHMSFVVPKS